MAIGFERKTEVVDQVGKLASNAVAIGVAHCRGLNVGQLAHLRTLAYSRGVLFRVVKNTLAKRAFSKGGWSSATDALQGPVILGFSEEEPGAVAAVMREFSKQVGDSFSIVGLGVGGEFFGPERLNNIADLPTREAAISQLAGVMLAPVGKLARTLNEIPSKAARALRSVADTKR